MNAKSGLTRRQFIKSNFTAALAASAFPAIIPGSALGRNGAVSPSERVVLGAIGVGVRAQHTLPNFFREPNCQVVALSDVRKDMLAKSKAIVDEHYQNNDCQEIADFRQLVARKDIDAVLISSTDHWHVLHALAAVRAGKDVYVEKPLGLSQAQRRELRQEVNQRERIFQFGTQQRSERTFRLACELVRNGCIGELKHINVWSVASGQGGSTRIVPPPATLDYDFWLGPAPSRPYTENLEDHMTWWFVSDFALGFIPGWGIHPIDIALWGAGDRAAGVVELEGRGRFPTQGICDTATKWDIQFQFKSGTTMRFVGAPGPEDMAKWSRRYGKAHDHGTAFEGSNGWIKVDRYSFATSPESLLDLELQPAKLPKKLLHNSDHARNFLDAVKTRQPTVAPIEDAVRSDTFCHVADIAIRLKRKMRYDGRAERIIGDAEANGHLQDRPMRTPWKLT